MNLKRFLLGTEGMKLLELPKGDPLDRALYHWHDGTPFLVRELLKSVAIFGQIGSGKSSGSGLLLARAAVKLPNSGGLILASKPEDRDFWERIFKEAGRLDDLIVFGKNEPARCNFLDFELKQGGDARSLTEFLVVTGESLSKGGTGENGKYWEMIRGRILYNAIEPLRVGWGEASIPWIQKFISTACTNPAEQWRRTLKEGEAETPRHLWEKGAHYQTLLRAQAAAKSAVEESDFHLNLDFWMNEFPYMDNKVRSTALADVTNVLHTYNTGIVREMVSTTTTVSPADMEKGKWIFMDFPLARYGDSGKLIMHGMKLLTQKYILRRHAKPGDPVIVIHADEAQNMINSFDFEFLSMCRSHHGCMIYLTQSIHAYFAAMGKEDYKAKGFLTNFATKIFHTLGDGESAQWASNLLGQRREQFTSSTPKSDLTLGEEIFGNAGSSYTTSETYQPILQPSVFQGGWMRTGGPPSMKVDGIVIKPERFLSGENYLFTSFDQR